MARPLTAAQMAALEKGDCFARDFVWFTVRNRDTGGLHSEGYWSDVGTVDAPVIDPDTGAQVVRTYVGVGTLIEAGHVPLVSNLTVQTVQLRLSQVSDHVQDLLRGYDAKQGRVEVHRGVFDPSAGTVAMIGPAFPRFVGFIDSVQVPTPAEGGTGAVTVTCRSHTAELTRFNPARRSDADQQARHPGDTFYRTAGAAAEVAVFWGTRDGRGG